MIPTSALAIVVVPVYGGHVAPLAMERLRNIRGLDAPTVLVAVYGNRAYEKALMEFGRFCHTSWNEGDCRGYFYRGAFV